MKIDENQDLDYDMVRITNLGFVDPYGNEGLVVLKSDNNKDCLLYTSDAADE